MPTIAFGDQVWDAADPIFEEDEGHFRVEDIVTVVEHEHVKETDLEVDTIDADDIVTGDLEATTIETSYVKSDGIDVDVLHTSVMEVTDELIYRNQQYVVSNKFQPLDLANVQADEEDAPYDTIVTRSLVNGTRINNLQVRADDTTAFQSSGPQGNFPGLFFTEGWCSERLTMLEDGHGLYIVADEQGVVDPDAFVRWGHLAANVWGFQANDDTNQTQILPGSLQLQGGNGQAGPVGSSVSVTDAAGVAQLTIADNGMIEVRRTAASTNPVLSIRDHQDQLLWTLNADGHFSHASHPVSDPTHAAAGAGPDMSVLSGAFADSSIFLGSAKQSYDRAAHELKFEKLKHQMPKYFSDLSITESSLPSGYTTATMSVQRYLALARQLASDDTLHLKEVFPSGHTVDWEVIDAPVPDLKADVVEALSDIVTLEGEMDTAQAAIVTAQADIVTLQGASGGLGSAATISNTDGDASLTISATGATPETKIVFNVDDTGNSIDKVWEILTDKNEHSDLLIRTPWSPGVYKEAIRCFADGSIAFGKESNSGFGTVFGRSALFHEATSFYSDVSLATYNKNLTTGTGAITCGSVIVSGTSLGPAVAANVTAIAAIQHSLELNETHMNPGQYYNWPLLTGKTVLHHNSTQSSRYRLPEFPVDGQQLTIFCSSGGAINLHTGAFGDPDRTFHPNSTGLVGTTQCNLGSLGTQIFHCVYTEDNDQWLLI